MKTQIKPKKCQHPDCDKTFTPRRSTTEKFCSPGCAKPFFKPPKRSPLKQPDAGQRIKRTRIERKTPPKKISGKMKKLLSRYSRIKADFMNRPENKVCPVFPSMAYSTTDIHHKKGRSLGYHDEWAEQNDIPYLLDERFFLAVSRRGHIWIHDHDKEARERGFILDRLSNG